MSIPTPDQIKDSFRHKIEEAVSLWSKLLGVKVCINILQEIIDKHSDEA